MRFIYKQTLLVGDTRNVKLFLWYPLRIDNETRWLETVTVFQVYDGHYWKNMHFVN